MEQDLFKNMWHFQREVFRSLAEGRSVILQAPTGAGKTRAAINPLLFNLAEVTATNPTKFPRRCIYSVPMRVLANQFVADYHSGDMESYVRQERVRPEPDVTIQTGEHPTDPHFEGTLIFATIDQVLSGFLNIPYGVSNRQANLNAGAIVSSYLVFDEFHLFDPDTALPTTLEMLKLLKDITPFILMTATFSRTMLKDLAEILNAEIIPPLDADVHAYFGDIPSQQAERERIFAWVDQPLTADKVLANRGHRTICICNLVDRATQLYDDLMNHPDRNGVEITLLHARFLQQDRAVKEQSLREIFGSASYDYAGPPHILIATQVIEVGLDITCDVMHTELAPASSLLQRAGRCARREKEKGQVFVYDPPDDPPESARPLKYAPYHVPDPKQKLPTARGKTLMDNTKAALESGQFTGKHMDFELEQAFINEVHTEVDAGVLTQLKAGDNDRLDLMFETIAELERGNAPRLIRKTEDTRYVIIHPNPNGDDNVLKYPWYYQGFSLRPNMMARAWKQMDEEGSFDPELLPWVVMEARADEADTATDDGEGQFVPRYKWEPLNDSGDIYKATLAIALHPHFAAYTQERGLILGEIAERSAPPLTPPEKQNRGRLDGYTRETYAEHIAGLYTAYTREHPTKVWRADKSVTIHRPSLHDEIAYTLRRIEESPRFELRPGLIDEVIRLMLALHDVGKLSMAWQRFAHEWQHIIGKDIETDYMAAHTDYDSWDEAQRNLNKDLQRKMPRGNHAGEGAVAAIPLLMNICQQAEGGWERLFRAVITAIARHHTPTVKDYSPFSFDPAASEAIAEALELVGLAQYVPELEAGIPPGIEDETGSLEGNLIMPTRHHEADMILYMLLVRVLRLADGRSFGV